MELEELEVLIITLERDYLASCEYIHNQDIYDEADIYDLPF